MPYPTALREILGTRSFWPPVIVLAFAFAMMMAYISASPFVYQNVMGLSKVAYGIIFGVNAFGLIASGWVASRLADRVDPAHAVRVVMSVQVVAAVVFAVMAASSSIPRLLLGVPIFLAVTTVGAILGNAAALAMDHAGAAAGTGRAVLGFLQFGLGAAASPIVGLGGDDSALVPACVMATSSLVAFVVAWRYLRPGTP
jgi:DHA1 family bicyclomycin/chloramphenicol resistance-like MFS transporter